MSVTKRLAEVWLALSLGLAFSSPSISAALVDFEGDPAGPLENGYQPTGTHGFAFNFISAELGDYGIASDANAFRSTAFGSVGVISNSGFVIITTPEPDNIGNMTAIAFEFGNDDPAMTSPGHLALMRVMLGGAIIDEVSVQLNRDGALNQAISFEGSEFARIEFAFTDSLGDPILGLNEVIDNLAIRFTSDPEPEPEPKPESISVPTLNNWALLLLVFCLVGIAVRKTMGFQ